MASSLAVLDEPNTLEGLYDLPRSQGGKFRHPSSGDRHWNGNLSLQRPPFHGNWFPVS